MVEDSQVVNQEALMEMVVNQEVAHNPQKIWHKTILALRRQLGAKTLPEYSTKLFLMSHFGAIIRLYLRYQL